MKKELLKAQRTSNNDYLILVKWNNIRTLYVVAHTWNPLADGWTCGHYFTNLESAEIYFNKKWEEEK